MRRLLSVALVLLVSVAFTGCQKDGVFNPKNKISKVYKAEKGNKVLWEKWTWDGNSLNNIAYFVNDTTMLQKAYYLYEKKRLARVENTIDLSYVLITYSGSQYEKVEFFNKYDGKLRTYVYTYDGKKVSKIVLTVYKYPLKSMDAGDDGFLSAFIPREILEETNRQILNSAPLKDNEDKVYTYELKFDGDNLSEWKITDNNDPNKPVEATFQYEKYDKNNNPHYASYSNIYGVNIAEPCFYKNNPERVTCTKIDNTTTTITYDYYYKYNDKKFPTEAIQKLTQETATFSDTLYYEYN